MVGGGLVVKLLQKVLWIVVNALFEVNNMEKIFPLVHDLEAFWCYRPRQQDHRFHFLSKVMMVTAAHLSHHKMHGSMQSISQTEFDQSGSRNNTLLI